MPRHGDAVGLSRPVSPERSDGRRRRTGAEPEPAESVSDWLADVMVLLAHAEEGVTLEAKVLADFEPEADVEMRLRRGETIALLQGVSPPDGWAVALRRGVLRTSVAD